VDVTVSSRHLELTDALRRAAEEKIGRLERFLDGIERAEVHFSEEKNPRIADRDVCEVTIEGHGHHVRTKATAGDPFAAVDVAVNKLEQQLHKLKTKLASRSQPRRRKTIKPAAEPSVEEALLEAEEDELDQGPQIVKSKRFEVRALTPDEAVEQMDLVSHDFYFFRNVDTDRPAVVYKRNSGGIGLIDEA
jgi:putative sigma-54 modulation protein